MKKYKYWTSKNLNIEKDSEIYDAADFLQSNFCPKGADRMWSLEYFKWKIGSENPAGRGVLSCAFHNNKIVGVASLTKKRVLIDGEELVAAEVGDTYTLPSIMRRGKPVKLSSYDQNSSSYVNKSIFGRLINDLTNQAINEGIFIIYGTPNKNSYPGYTKKLGYFEIGAYQNSRYIRPTSNYLVQTYKTIRPIGGMIKFFESAMLISQQFLYKNLFFNGFDFCEGIPSEEEINDLWQSIRPKSGFSLVRDYLYWSHRYLNHPIASYRFFTIYKNGVLIAMATTRIFTTRKNNKSIAIVEWMTQENKIITYMLLNILKYFKKENANYYYYWSDKNCENAPFPKSNLFFIKDKVPIIFSGTREAKLLDKKGLLMSFYLGSSDAI